ncbi:MAG: hypothetical protein GF353_11215 [Candidatus Lokiarchaeota archaeon]|nr:hypothetical protein [Candidatus Lokiarchaeota archaeon]
MNNQKTLEAYKTLSKFMIFGAKGQPPLWPFSIVETNWYYTKFFPKEIYHTITSLEKKGIKKEDIAKLCWGPSAISHWFYIIEPAFGDPELNPFEGLSKKEGIDFIEKTIEILSIQRKGDTFCRDNKNILIDEQEIAQLINGRNFITTNKNFNITKSLRGLIMTLWHYAILIQVGHRAYSHEFHGPYCLPNDRILLIKEFFNLKPGENANNLLWNFSSGIPYKNITVLEIYDNAEIQIDMFNHYNVSGNLREFCIFNENSTLTIDEINELISISKDVIVKGNKIIKDFSKSDWVKKLIDLKYLWLKPHKDILGLDWRPPNELYNLVNETQEAERTAKNFEKNIVPMVRGLPPDKIIEKIALSFIEKLYS